MAQHALIIGIDTFRRDRHLQPLQFARADARATHEVFRDALGYGENAQLLLQPTMSQANDALHRVGEQVRAGDTFVFYFAGHGVQHQDDQYLLLHEVSLAALNRGDVVGNDLLSLSTLMRTVADWPAVHSAYILDACRTHLRKGARTASYSAEVQELISGLQARDVLLRRRPSVAGGEAARGSLVLNACADGQQAFEVEALGRGLFSHSFCRWLKEGARRGQARVLSAEVLDELAQMIESDAQNHQSQRGQRPWVDPQAKPVALWRPVARRESPNPVVDASVQPLSQGPRRDPQLGAAGKHALIVGIDNWRDLSIQDLKFARADARAIHEVFQHTLGYGGNAVLLLQPTLSEARSALHRVGEQVRAGDTFVFYFAGHARSTQEGLYLLLCGVRLAALDRGDVVDNDLLSLSRLVHELTDWPEVDRAFILDTSRQMLLKGVRSAGYAADFRGLLSGIHTRGSLLRRTPAGGEAAGRPLFLSACSDGQLAFEVEALGRGLFSYSLCNWLTEGVRNGQSRMLSPGLEDELAKQIEAVARQHGAPLGQRPWINPNALPVELWRQAAGGMLSDPAAPRALTAREMDNRLWLLAKSKVKAQGGKAYEDYLEKAPSGAAHLDEAIALIDAWHDEQAKAKAQAEAARQSAERSEREAAERARREKARREEKVLARRQAEARARREAEEAAEAKSQAERGRAETLKPGRRFKEAACAPEMVVIPAGKFVMGSPDSEAERVGWEGPQREVRIAQPFAVGRCVVTFAEYDLFAQEAGRELPSDEGWGRGAMPVINVSWEEAQTYVDWLNSELGFKGTATGPRYRLPTEAEWEYAARAGTKTAFWWGDTINPEKANYDGNYAYAGGAKGEYRGRTVKANAFEPNPWGVYQVHGNVWEWLQDGLHDGYDGAPTDGSEWKVGDDEAVRVLRGGSWNSYPKNLRAANRFRYTPDFRNSDIGFRIARTL